MALTDLAVRQAKPGPKPYKLADGAGLYLLVTPAGGKLWRFKYRTGGKEKLLAFGGYPEVSLADAHKRRDDARAQLAGNADPSREKRRAKIRERAEAMNTFAIISAEYCTKRKSDGQGGWSPATAKRSEYLLSRLNAAIGSLPIGEIEPSDILAAVKKIEAKGTVESAKRTLQLAPHVFVRPGELRSARWEEINQEAALWTIPAAKTKMRKDHRVPLSRQAVELLQQLHAVTGPAGYVFSSVRTRARPMSENTLNAGLRRLGDSVCRTFNASGAIKPPRIE